jgi:hypothetical protein
MIGRQPVHDRSILDLKMPLSEYWLRQCYAIYQSDPIGVKRIDEIGEDNIMCGSDFPHPDGVWPDSQEYIQRELGVCPSQPVASSSATTPPGSTVS